MKIRFLSCRLPPPLLFDSSFLICHRSFLTVGTSAFESRIIAYNFNDSISELNHFNRRKVLILFKKYFFSYI